MRAVIQRVKKARVRVDGEETGSIGRGLLVYLGIGIGDSAAEVDYMADKIVHMRIFDDDQGTMNLSLAEMGGELLCVSQFTLYADARKGRRPSYSQAAKPEEARVLYQAFLTRIEKALGQVAQGRFQAAMRVSAVVDGPVTILLDSKKEF